MTVVAVAALAVAAVAALAGFAALRWQARSHDRERHAWTAERGRLVEELCHLADRPLPDRRWTQPQQTVGDGREAYVASPMPDADAY